MSDNSDPSERKSFTGRRFSRKPRQRVLLQDRFAQGLITLSGIGGIAAVSLVGLFLVWVVLPLLAPAELENQGTMEAGAVTAPLTALVDDYGTMVWALLRDGTLAVSELATGEILDRIPVRPGFEVRSHALSGSDGYLALGYADGSIQIVRVQYTTEYHADADVPAEYRTLKPGERTAFEKGIIERTPEGQLRHQIVVIELEEPMLLGEGPILHLDVSRTTSGLATAAMDSTGMLHHRNLTWKTNMLTGRRTLRSRGGSFPLPPAAGLVPGDFRHLALNDTGDLVLLVGKDGRSLRYQKSEGNFEYGGVLDLLPDSDAVVTAVGFLTGKGSLVVGDDHGGVNVWFPVVSSSELEVPWVLGHVLGTGESPVTCFGPSARSRMMCVGYADGGFEIFQITTEQSLAAGRMEQGPMNLVAVSPRQDQVLTWSGQGTALWRLNVPHADVSMGSLFAKVWYEGYPEPTYVWQSSAGSDSFEPKLSLIPLISGTLKATFYSMLFGLPLAVLAAIYTSEFLPKQTRAKVKPVIEVMASLPSVVLGFLAALVMAPIVERDAVEILSILLLAPWFALLGAHLWQLVPRDTATRLESWRPVSVGLALLIGAVICWNLGPGLETLGFGGNFKGWLDGQNGSGTAGWVVLLLVPCGVLVTWLNMRYGEGFIRSSKPGVGAARLATLDLGRFLASSAATLAVALFLAWMLDSTGWDPRGSVFDTYVQRNALVVGIAMGFAIIPIIYTISEDALVSVPDHLRAASLGAGATPWQTAIRVVIPTAMSGLFSAAMIGLGRAVGETMIVLMAAGNTPIMDMNIFNGFRTLSANLAVELPEAVQNSTHYRTLFLAALVLFIMTFILNTVAEAVRLHFRGKTKQL